MEIFTQVTIGIAALIVLYSLGIEFFKYLNNRSKNDSANSVVLINNLLKKIDTLIDSIHDFTGHISVSIANQSSEKKEIINILNQHGETLREMDNKVSVIEERTRKL